MRMLTSRRQFLKISVTVAGGVAVIGTAAALLPRRFAQAWYRRLTNPVLATNSPTGPLSAHAIQTLMAATETLLSFPVERYHYEDFFQWYAKNVTGYKVLYDRFTQALDRSARQSAKLRFAECDAVVRQRILENTFQISKNKFRRLWMGIFERDRLLFSEYIMQPTLKLFARTDAWILLGYESWPGMPRGLDQYRQAPVEARQIPLS